MTHTIQVKQNSAVQPKPNQSGLKGRYLFHNSKASYDHARFHVTSLSLQTNDTYTNKRQKEDISTVNIRKCIN